MGSDDTHRELPIPSTSYSRGVSTIREGEGDKPGPDVSRTAPDDRDRRAREWLSELMKALEFIDPDGVDSTSDCDTDQGKQNQGLISEEGGIEGIVLFHRFKLKRKVGEGGFGIVLLADDNKLGRDVALKVPRPGRTLSKSDAYRFFNDAYAPARLCHNNIVKVHDVGDLGPMGCYIVSEFCNGPNLRDWMKKRGAPVPPRLAARIVEELADAVEHAHWSGIFHRDIKPDNILIVSRRERSGKVRKTEDSDPERPSDPIEDDDAMPILVDFGLARISDGRAETSRSGRLLGTLAYSPPESVTGRRGQIGPWSDVYGLGATFYELLVGRAPFQGDSDAETVRLVMEADPVSPRSLRPAIPRDLETVCLKCLNKVPKNRLASAGELRDELRRFLNHEPTKTRPAPAWELAWKLARRKPLVATLAGVAVAAVLALVGALVWRDSMIRESDAQARRHNKELEREVARANRLAKEADAQRRIAEERRFVAERHLQVGVLREVRRALDAGKIEAAHLLLQDRRNESDPFHPPDFAWRYLWHEAHRRLTPIAEKLEPTNMILQSRDRRFLAILYPGEKLDIREVLPSSTRTQSRLVLRLNPSLPHQFTFSTDSKYFIVKESTGKESRPGYFDIALTIVDIKEARVVEQRCEVRTVGDPSILDYQHASRRVILHCSDGILEHWLGVVDLSNKHGTDNVRHASGDFGTGVYIDPTGRNYFDIKDWKLQARDVLTGEVRKTFPRDVDPFFDSSLPFFDFSADGRYIGNANWISAGPRQFGLVRTWETATGWMVVHDGTPSHVVRFTLSDTGKWLAYIERSGLVTLTNQETLRSHSFQTTYQNLTGGGFLSFSADERKLAVLAQSSGGGLTIPSIWDAETRRLIATYPGLPIGGQVYFSPDGRTLFASGARFATAWHFDRPAEMEQVQAGTDEIWALAFSPDGKTIAVGTDNAKPDSKTIRFLDRETGREIAACMGHTATVSALAFSPDGKLLASGSLDQTGANLIVWDVATRSVNVVLKGHAKGVRSIAFSPDGRTLLSASDDQTLRIWDTSDGKSITILEGHTDKVRLAVYSPDGKSVASASLDKTVRIWDVATKAITTTLTVQKSIQSVTWSPDGALIAAADEDGDINIWDVSGGGVVRTLHTELDELRCLAFSPDGRNLAAGGVGKIVRIWDVIIGQELLSLPGHVAQINTLAFAPDGQLLVSGDHAGMVRFWRADSP